MAQQDIIDLLMQSANEQRSFADRLRDQRAQAGSTISQFVDQTTPQDMYTSNGVPLAPSSVSANRNSLLKAVDTAVSPYSPELEQGYRTNADNLLLNLLQAEQKDGGTLEDLLAQRKKLADAGFDTSPIDEQLKAAGLSSAVDEDAQAQKNEIVRIAQELLGDKSLFGGTKSISGFFQALAKVPGTKAADAANKYDTIKSLLTLENIDKMKGVLSDSDIKILQQASSELNRNQSEKAFRKSLENIISNLGGSSEEYQPSYNEDDVINSVLGGK